MDDSSAVEPAEKAEDKRADLMTASAFVLDFLYPRGSLSLLRRLNRITLDGYEKPSFRFKNPLSRLQAAPVTSTAYNRSAAAPERIEEGSWPTDPGTQGSATANQATTTFEDAFGDVHVVNEPHAQAADGPIQITDEYEFKKFLELKSWGVAETVWDKYDHLALDVRDSYLVEVLRYVALSERLIEPQRYCDLLFSVSPIYWTAELVRGGIRAALSLDDFSSALAFSSHTLNTGALVHGFDLLLTHTLRNGEWDRLLEVWDTFRDRLGNEDMPQVLELPETVSTPALSERLQELWQRLRSISLQQNFDSLKEKYRSLLYLLATRFLPALRYDDAKFIVEQLAEAVPFEELIKLCAEREETTHAAELYFLYRKLPDVKIRIPILREMLGVFFPHNDHGMETVLKDWYSRYENLDYIAYRRFIQFYSSRGDVKSVLRLWKEYKTLYAKGRRAERDFRTVSALMHVYAVRGQVGKARSVLKEITLDRGIRPDTAQMNMLLNAHAKAWDLRGAFQTFAEICEHGEPDDYSFGTLMGITGSRGHVQITSGLYKIARDMKVRPSIAMVDALVEAYCQNDRIADAENICNITTTRKMLPGTVQRLTEMPNSGYTVLWNTVLNHYALRQDLTNVNRVLQTMTNLKVPYDDRTYRHILEALVRARQAHHALALVEISQQNGIFVPTAEHYMLLMSGFLRTREPAAVVAISKMMTEKNFPESAEKMTKLMQAFGQWAEVEEGKRLGTSSHRFLVAALAAFRSSLGSEDRRGRDDLRSVTDQYSKMINVLVQMRQFATIPEIMALFESQFPENSSPEATPLQLLNSLIRAEFYEGRYDQVKQTWKVICAKVKGVSDRPAPDSIPLSVSQNPEAQQELAHLPPSHRYFLSQSIGMMMRVLESENDVQGLIDLVDTVTSKGLALGQRNWNYYVQALTRLGRWTEACHVCEQHLMPNWHGWARQRVRDRKSKNALPLDLRRLGKSDRVARPNTHTLLLLIKQYMELENMAPWSSDSGKLLDAINQECPRLVRAAKTMIRADSELERHILAPVLGDKDDILKFILKDEETLRTEDERREIDLGMKVLPVKEVKERS
jgi:pentatricopeptide repeat-containing protein PET309